MIAAKDRGRRVRDILQSSTSPYYALFFLSGFPALIYQIVWQRALFTFYGVNIESVTVIVTAFMLGLGFGSLAGGTLSKLERLPLLPVFGAIEIGIGLFGVFSLSLFHRVALVSAGASAPKTGLITMSMLLVPTLLMGATLPLLVTYLVRVTHNVGESVGVLYAANTFGSATACIIAASLTMRLLGESGSVRMAAALNIIVGCSVLLIHRSTRRHAALGLSDRAQLSALGTPVDKSKAIHALSFRIALILSAVAGFISLAYEIVWYRLYSFVSGGTAPCFALLLGFYLGGIACGSLIVRDLCREKLRDDSDRVRGILGSLVIWAGVAGFLIGPVLAEAVRYVPFNMTFPFVFVSAALLGAAFPLLSHAAISPADQTGNRLSQMYVANIIGSASGSYIVGFVLMDHWPVQSISLFLLALAAVSAVLLLPLSTGRTRRFTAFGLAAAMLVGLVSPRLFANFYEKLLYKREFSPSLAFRHLVETRSGVVGVSRDGTVYGGGVYDGRFNTDLVHDTNGIFRAFAIVGVHPKPSEVLMIGLSSGSWAQVIANCAGVEQLTIVEINPGYLRLIERYPAVAGILRNPKVQIEIDDGRRWLVRNPHKKFDLIVMNTTYHWRAHISNLLSMEFLALARRHLNGGGMLYYNTTSSGEALLTGATVFPYSLRVWNFLAVSDSPIHVDKQRWEEQLSSYKVEGKVVFDLSDAEQRRRLNEVLSLVDTLDGPGPAEDMSMELGDSLRQHWKGRRLITDDNMGSEWSAIR